METFSAGARLVAEPVLQPLPRGYAMALPHIAALHRQQLMRWWGWLLLTTILFQLLIACRYFAVADLDQSPIALLFRGTMLVAHFATLSLLLLGPVLVLILLRPRPWLAIAVGVSCSSLILLALIVDTQVYQLYRFHINAGVLNLLLGGAARTTFVFPEVMYFQAGLVAAAVALIQIVVGSLWWRYVRRRPGSRLAARAIAVTLLGLIVSFHGVHIWADVIAYEALLEQTDLLPLRYAATAKRSLRAMGVNVRSQPAWIQHASSDRNGLAYPSSPLDCHPPRRPPNIIVILIDSWRFDALSAQVTPNIEAFVRRSVRFMDHHSGGNATRIGVFSLFYSIPGTYWHRVLIERQGPVVIEQLVKHSYDVQVFRSAPLFSPEFDRTVFAQIDDVRMQSDGNRPADRDQDLTDDFLSFLKSRSNTVPFFAFLFYDAPHSVDLPADYPLAFQPSAAGINYLELRNETDARPLLNRYWNSVHYVDHLVGKALTALEAQGLFENSIIVITGDHGQEFNDNRRNYWGHGSNFTRYQIGVPLLLYAPALAPAVHSHRTTHFDVMPTLMREYLGCGEPFSTYSVGASLFEVGGRETMIASEYADFAIVQPDRIVVVREQGMEVRGADYAELKGARLELNVIATALEQKSRFHQPLAPYSP